MNRTHAPDDELGTASGDRFQRLQPFHAMTISLSPGECARRFNHTFAFIRGFTQGRSCTVGALNLPKSFPCPCGQFVRVPERIWPDEAVIVCPECQSWHTVIWR